MYFFVIDFNKTAPDQVSFRVIVLGYGDNLTKSSRNNTLALFRTRPHHSVSFSTSSLPIREYGSIISIENIVNKRESTLLINVRL